MGTAASVGPSDVLAVGLPLIKRFEGFRKAPYLCPAFIPTIGYGSTYYEDGRKVSLTDEPISQERAESLLRNVVLREFLPAVVQLCPTLEDVNQIAAILSWTYNLGIGALRGSSLRKKILNEDWEAVPAEMLKWNIAAGKVNSGLDKRRRLEISIFVTKPN